MRHLLALTLVLVASTADAQSLKGTAMHGTTIQRATIGGVLNGTRVTLDVNRVDDGTNHRTWATLDIYDTPPGGSEPTQLRLHISQPIADADFDVSPHVSRVRSTLSDGTRLEIDWTVTDAVHLQYDANWRNTTNGTLTKLEESRDTRSAALTGTLLGIALAPRTGQVETSTSQETSH